MTKLDNSKKIWVVTLKEMVVSIPIGQINEENISTVQVTGETVIFTNKEVIRPLTAFAESMEIIKEYMSSSKNIRISIVSTSRLGDNIDIMWAVAYGNDEVPEDKLLYAVCKKIDA